MMPRAMMLLLAAIAFMRPSGLAYAEGQYVHHLDQLRCGGISVRLPTTCLEQTSSGWECVSQSLQLIDRNGTSKDIPLDIRRVPSSIVPGLEAVDGYVAEWACVRSRWGQHYVDIFYTCRVFGDDCGTLSPSEEWDQVIDMSGHVVAGSRNGIKAGLLQRLGLDSLLHGGIDVIGVGPVK
jgi:hypothetical protein